MEKMIERTLELFIIGVIIYLIIACSGCSALQFRQPDETVNPPPYQGITEITKTVRSINWLATMCIIGFAGSCMAGMNGLKWGWTGAAACLLGLGMTIATVRYSGLIAMAGLTGGVLFVIASVLNKKRIVSELVMGIQRLRKGSTTDEMLSDMQSKATQAEVAKTKMNLKLNGKMR